MIISASRRTDIPAFFSRWFINRIKAGFCTVPNPYNSHQIQRISLLPEDVDVIVFWTRNPLPIMPHLRELDKNDYRYYFHYTVTGYPRVIDGNSPPLETSIQGFQRLVDNLGNNKVIWRYDPILLSNMTDVDSHLVRFSHIANSLMGYTQRVVISFAKTYRKANQRFRKLMSRGLQFDQPDGILEEKKKGMLITFKQIADESAMEIVSCAESIDLSPFGIMPGKCMDDDLIQSLFDIKLSTKKDPSQREACRCVVSKDIGMYNTCVFGCAYCYATSSQKLAQKNYRNHKPDSPSLSGWFDRTMKRKNQLEYLH